MSFSVAMLEELAATPWLDGPTARGFVDTVAADHDDAVRALKDIGRSRDPLFATSDWLGPLAHDRLLLRAPVETDDEFRLRLSTVLDDWYWGGTSEGYLRFVFAPYGFTADTMQALSNHEVGGYWDGNEEWYSRVFFFLDAREPPVSLASDGVWSDAESEVWEEDASPDTETWDSTATVADLWFFRAAIRRTKASDAYPVTIAVWLSADTMPDGYWDSPGGVWPEDDPDAGGAVWCEDEDCYPLYWTLGNVWGQEAWVGDGPDSDLWIEDEEAELTDIEETERWIPFPGEEA